MAGSSNTRAMAGRETTPGKRGPSEVLERQELQNLVRIASDLREKQSLATQNNSDLSDNDDDPRLDPTSETFDHYRWAQRALTSLNNSGITLERQGVVFSNLSVSGSGSPLRFQETVVSSLLLPFRSLALAVLGRAKSSRPRRILHSVDGLLKSGELLLVLGRPGSGCSTFLKALCGHLEGLTLEPESDIHYQGIGFNKMTRQYRGEVAYNQEVDEHFPHLTVGQTLSFAAAARVPRQRPPDLTRQEYVDTMVSVVMAVFGLSHTFDTKVGDSFVHGVSGGERKRVSIAEMFLSRARVGAWDNSTRGLDAATALQFIKSLRLSADLGRACHAVAAYQSSQSMYGLFDKVAVLYEGREIFFGPCGDAVAYFEDMGWHRDSRQVASDFLTGITSPGERTPRPGMEGKVPRTAAEFAEYWRRSKEAAKLKADMEAYERAHPLDGKAGQRFQESHEKQQARHTRASSPYLLSLPMQIRLCLRRASQRMRNDMPTTMSTVIVQLVLSFIIGSIFYNSPNTSDAFFQKGAVLFFAVLINALITINEIMQLYSQRPIVEKQARYAFVHPFTEALASSIIDLPIKFLRCSLFSVVLYFLVGLRAEPGPFFVFYLFLITTVLVMSGIFRSAAAATRTVGQAMGVAGILILALVVYSGFMIPQSYMHPWFAWIRWINPIFYAFEALLSNEFHGREFGCAQLVPPYGTGNSFTCAAVGAVPGQRSIAGDAFLRANYGYQYSHLWRNYGILVAFLVFFHVTYLTATEFNKGRPSKAEALVFRPGHAPKRLYHGDVEAPEKDRASVFPTPGDDKMGHLPRHGDVLTWRALNYDIPVKEGTRRLLNDVSGWVKPGTLTALMGVSGAGKTTLLDVLAQRVSIGVVSGDILVNGQVTTSGFPRRAGYVQQQDLHLGTTTVREALRFSAVLRQPRSVSKADKYQYVEEVIQMLGMHEFAEAVVGSPGEGLNVEQRKLLSIGVELAAKPSLLIFLDEPTSGLDSQSSWTICAFLRRLADHGQAVLATIHQPSALLFQTFDRLLFLAQGGKTVYFGDLGLKSSTLIDYFSRAGVRRCGERENPAEYILEMVSGRDDTGIDWAEQWSKSPEHSEVLEELEALNRQQVVSRAASTTDQDVSHEFAQPLHAQFVHVAGRAFRQYFRQPEYIFTKFALGIASGLFIGFSFWKADRTQQGFQNALFGVFLLATIFPTLVNQIMPKFVAQRALYEVRERPSRVYSWKVFILSQMLVEVPWQVLLGICAWACFYFPVFGTGGTSDTLGLILLFVVQFYMYAATIAQMVVAAIPDPALGAMLAVLMFGMSFIFNGVMQPPDALPGFWIFMWRVSPFTYYVSGLAGAALHARSVVCSEGEMSVLDPPPGQSCGAYLAVFLEKAPGTLYNPDATSGCEYCALSSADQYLAARRIYWDERWRNYGIFWCYLVFNVFGTATLYYLFRVRTWKSRKVARP
ncbi:ABC multidrug transporter, putative [Metarhizium acridum CQMa 102]|uniref:ABC multidrug transporter, putative n=1 Tax=Metarhizium acridum (strain CQMa 102) TaxID=655827 RepID=E9EIA2_METAQ|nr:ABC multidrug transporter, putative [Metarhizium acridum CQMa 102]EFY84348.1 ABC multidrug transporter, putative [Metarhizium acridum CQMa 102]